MKKKSIKILLISIMLFFTIFIGKSNAASLDTIEIQTNKEKVAPGEEIVLTINFGKDLGSYTFDIAYDNNLLEYVTTDGGTPNDMGTKVRVVFYDSTGGTNPRQSMTITFRAKEGLETSNPTDLSVTAEGLANADASETYDDITVAMVKNITVEPNYQDYKFDLTYQGNPIINEEKEMTLKLSSPIGRFYDHARIIAKATTPDGGTIKLVGTDETDMSELDLIDSGWGDPSGYKIGGNVEKILQLRGLFSKAGKYTVTFELIDRDSSDQVIATNQFEIMVEDVTAPEETPGGETEGETNNPNEENNGISNENTNNEIISNQEINNNGEEKLPEELPKTGYDWNTLIGIALATIIILISGISYYHFQKKKRV